MSTILPGHAAVIAVLLLLASATVVFAAPGADPNAVHIDWPAFLHRSDMVWDQLPSGWDDAPFLGNGNLGTILWQDHNGPLWFEVSRSDLYDHRKMEGQYGALYSECRLPNGHFLLDFGAPAPTGNMRLDLWNAELDGNIQAGSGHWTLRSFTHAAMDLIVLDLANPDPNAAAPALTWYPDLAQSTRAVPVGSTVSLSPYPPQVQSVVDGVNVSVQSMPEDVQYRTDGQGVGQYATAWTAVKPDNGHVLYLISTKFSYPGTTAEQEAVDAVLKAKDLGLESLTESHRAWWHAYYPKSFLSIPDGALESFYWIQMYKMGSASRQGGPLIDLMGPWYKPTGWPAAWWNLNMQLTYWPFYMANHLAEAEPLQDTLWNNRAMLAANAAPYQADSYAIGRATGPTLEGAVGKEIGNLPWTMHNLWLWYRSSMDDEFLRDKLFPLMKGSYNEIRHIAVVQPDGKLGLPATASPEYTDSVANCSYTLACFRWLASAIIQADSRLKTHDPIVKDCRYVLANLVPYPVDPATGIEVGEGMPFNHTHRHWSHLFMIYPFHEWDWDDPARRPLMEKSLANWTSNTSGFAGYSWLGAASMYAADGHGDKALDELHTFLKKSPLPNTLYREGSPVIETPLACARIVQELLMTSYGDTIRIFPGVPPAWGDASFADLRAEGAFLVSADRKDGATQFVRITSLAGEPLRVRTGLAGRVIARGDRHFTVTDRGDGVVQIDLAKGETVTLVSSDARMPIDTTIAPVAWPGAFVPWGGQKSLQPDLPPGPVGLKQTVKGGPNVVAFAGSGFSPGESPANAVDGNLTTKFYIASTDGVNPPGVNSGILIPFTAGARVVNGLQLATANDEPQRDPVTITVEGSNAANADLPGGDGFVLLWEGGSGLAADPGREAWGARVDFPNTVAYKVYRILVTGTRAASSGTQFSEIKLITAP